MSDNDQQYQDDFTHTEVSVISNRIDLEDSSGRRKAVRFYGSLTAVISGDHQTFRTTTLNVSSGGVLLNELIPAEFVGKHFDILLIADRPGQAPTYIMARGRALGAPLRTPRVQFVKTPVEIAETLSSLFN